MSSLNESVLENTALYKFLGVEDVADLRRMVKEMIVDEIRDQLQESSYYILSPDDIASLLDEVADEAVAEVKEEYKKVITNALAAKLSDVKISI